MVVSILISLSATSGLIASEKIANETYDSRNGNYRLSVSYSSELSAKRQFTDLRIRLVEVADGQVQWSKRFVQKQRVDPNWDCEFALVLDDGRVLIFTRSGGLSVVSTEGKLVVTVPDFVRLPRSQLAGSNQWNTHTWYDWKDLYFANVKNEHTLVYFRGLPFGLQVYNLNSGALTSSKVRAPEEVSEILVRLKDEVNNFKKGESSQLSDSGRAAVFQAGNLKVYQAKNLVSKLQELTAQNGDPAEPTGAKNQSVPDRLLVTRCILALDRSK